jgi:hypothetical protein
MRDNAIKDFKLNLRKYRLKCEIQNETLDLFEENYEKSLKYNDKDRIIDVNETIEQNKPILK